VTETDLRLAAANLNPFGETFMDTLEKILREAIGMVKRPAGCALIAVGFILGAVIL